MEVKNNSYGTGIELESNSYNIYVEARNTSYVIDVEPKNNRESTQYRFLKQDISLTKQNQQFDQIISRNSRVENFVNFQIVQNF